jgi:hypothetical protein
MTIFGVLPRDFFLAFPIVARNSLLRKEAKSALSSDLRFEAQAHEAAGGRNVRFG